ncbi:hypothetical protein CH249_15380 [Rhodococcus sp. 05-2255-3B1]|uniref:hypothetical protein n=1 Tax=unclassified Rhodococcus (in: high G+C Gram-positive bacteria) TaxID=192944 RepID=UPI000B9C2421|nr:MULTISPECIES: hypothetical protein [unclassified Rhodococcus (in: high G+C Gram-positive bacteria)]OZE03172.1 hypothetical protein CH250_23445 [Rhodococcus sp. 05-2255-3C]OZE09561.1 hypothetical protein CH249_15380 [Rhodococcus sp. 05-2255-3B1]OZE14827.1 hypothetical protein CH255_21725 [Rhodococcus sp. 05-2255-2A2]
MPSIVGGSAGGVDWLASEWSQAQRLLAGADDLIGEPLREGIPVSQWRSLPDSPTAEPDKLRQ